MPVYHYHICWSGSKFDWQVFSTRDEAEAAAQELVLPNENYTIEQFDGDCPQCCEVMKPRVGT